MDINKIPKYDTILKTGRLFLNLKPCLTRCLCDSLMMPVIRSTGQLDSGV